MKCYHYTKFTHLTMDSSLGKNIFEFPLNGESQIVYQIRINVVETIITFLKINMY